MQNFYILLAFLLITIALLIAISFYCYFIKYRAKKETLLPFCDANIWIKKKFYVKECIIKMSNKVKDIDIKNRTYYYFNNIRNKKQ